MLKAIWRARRAHANDEGMGLILVIGTASVVTALMIVLTTMATRSLTSSRQHVSYEGAIALAEDGVDQLLARTQKNYQTVGMDNYAYPSTSSTCGGYSSINWTSSSAPDGTPAPGSFANPNTGLTYERAWAKSWLTTLAATCRINTGQGDYVY